MMRLRRQTELEKPDEFSLKVEIETTVPCFLPCGE